MDSSRLSKRRDRVGGHEAAVQSYMRPIDGAWLRPRWTVAAPGANRNRGVNAPRRLSALPGAHSSLRAINRSLAQHIARNVLSPDRWLLVVGVTPGVERSGRGDNRRSREVVDVATPDGPHDACQLIGDRDRRLVLPTPLLHAQRPVLQSGERAMGLRPPARGEDDRAGAMREQAPQIDVPPFADGPEPPARATRIFTRRQSQPRREGAGAREALNAPD